MRRLLRTHSSLEVKQDEEDSHEQSSDSKIGEIPDCIPVCQLIWLPLTIQGDPERTIRRSLRRNIQRCPYLLPIRETGRHGSQCVSNFANHLTLEESQSKKNSSRVQVHMLTVRLSYISEVDTKFIKLSTPHYQYTLWFSNPGIMEEWVRYANLNIDINTDFSRYLRLVYEMKSEDINLPSSNSSTSMYDRPSNEIASYNYSESVEKVRNSAI